MKMISPAELACSWMKARRQVLVPKLLETKRKMSDCATYVFCRAELNAMRGRPPECWARQTLSGAVARSPDGLRPETLEESAPGRPAWPVGDTNDGICGENPADTPACVRVLPQALR